MSRGHSPPYHNLSQRHIGLDCLRYHRFLAESPGDPRTLLPHRGFGRIQSDKEGHKLDALEHQVYSSGAVGLRVVNLSAIMGLYNRLLWEKLVPFADNLPQDKLLLAKALIEEGLRLAKQHVTAARHDADCHSWAMGSGLVMRHHTWLRASALPSDAQAKLEDLPFEDKELFSQETDDVLEKICKYKLQLLVGDSPKQLPAHLKIVLRTLRSLGLMVNMPKSKLTPAQMLQFIRARLDTSMARHSHSVLPMVPDLFDPQPHPLPNLGALRLTAWLVPQQD
ncbi:UNVERIFIED_CONTAM: hypothetical protein K2H54_008017 [Gekko kuhli]